MRSYLRLLYTACQLASSVAMGICTPVAVIHLSVVAVETCTALRGSLPACWAERVV